MPHLDIFSYGVQYWGANFALWVMMALVLKQVLLIQRHVGARQWYLVGGEKNKSGG